MALAGARSILALTGSGTRVLDLLAGDADTVVALDANPVQNALLSLKAAALAHLDRDDHLAFLGITPSTRRRVWYRAMRPLLPVAARSYWDKNQRAIARGVFHAGAWERLLRFNARFLALFRRRAVGAVMNAATLDAQAAAWAAGFARPGPLRTVETIGRDMIWRLTMREPAADHLPDARTVGATLDAAFADAAARFLFRESDTATLSLKGRIGPGDALPLYLRAENHDRVRANLPRLRIVEGALADAARATGERFDGFSLSDFGSYCGPADYRACWDGVVAAASPGTRFCERIFINAGVPPPGVSIDAALSARLTATDRAVIYRIRAGTVG